MKRLVVATVASAALFIVPAAPATIHPIMLGWWCGNASGDPPGQTPGPNHSDQSTLRALQATGLLTVTPATDTGTPTNPGALNCAGAPSARSETTSN